jgi:hypothetical protein
MDELGVNKPALKSRSIYLKQEHKDPKLMTALQIYGRSKFERRKALTMLKSTRVRYNKQNKSKMTDIK